MTQIFPHHTVVYGYDWVGIVTTQRERVDGWAALEAWRRSNGQWVTHDEGHTGSKARRHPDPDAIWADYTRACLLGEVKDIT